MAQDVGEFELFLDKPWSDGLPVVIPTEARVQRMLQGTSCVPDEVVGLIPPLLEPATVRTVAIHALMAGCKPAYVPVVLGGLRLMLREEFNLNGVQGTMHGVAPLMIVSGPYAQHIGLHGGPWRRWAGLSRQRRDWPGYPLAPAEPGGRHPGRGLGHHFRDPLAVYGLPDREPGGQPLGKPGGRPRLCRP
jgi:hypothetical protein